MIIVVPTSGRSWATATTVPCIILTICTSSTSHHIHFLVSVYSLCFWISCPAYSFCLLAYSFVFDVVVVVAHFDQRDIDFYSLRALHYHFAQVQFPDRLDAASCACADDDAKFLLHVAGLLHGIVVIIAVIVITDACLPAQAFVARWSIFFIDLIASHWHVGETKTKIILWQSYHIISNIYW